jgi:hypothetical protein
MKAGVQGSRGQACGMGHDGALHLEGWLCCDEEEGMWLESTSIRTSMAITT